MRQRIDPQFNRHLVEARAHYRRGSFSCAMRALLLAQGRNPAQPEVHRLLGLCYARQGRLDEAREALREAIRLNPLDFLARGSLAVLLSHDGEADSAIEQLEHGISVLQEGAASAHQEARAMVESGRLHESLALLRRAAWLRLGSAVLQYYLSEVFTEHSLLELAFRD